MMKRHHAITFLIWMAVFNWPPILDRLCFRIPSCVLPFLFWVAIPVRYCGLGDLMGEQHYILGGGEALLLTPLAWMLTIMFWVLLSAAITATTVLCSGRLYRRRNNKK